MDLSDESDYEEMAMQDLVKKLTQPPSEFMLPKITHSQIKNMTEGKQAFQTFVSNMPEQLQPYITQSYK